MWFGNFELLIMFFSLLDAVSERSRNTKLVNSAKGREFIFIFYEVYKIY